MVTAFSLFLAMANPPAPAGSIVTPFRTEVSPRLDPVFGDISVLRKAVDEFLSLQLEMERVRSDFSTAVHTTLASLAPAGTPTAKTCPPGASVHYARALEAGKRYLALGRRLEGRFREIRRSETLGDSVGLTPDYRWKIKKAQALYSDLVRDYREMRVAFYDQLGAEMRFSGCELAGAPAPAVAAGATDDGAANENPADPAAWELEAVTEAAAREKAEIAARAGGRKQGPLEEGLPQLTASGPAIWIEIDNTLCGQPSRLFIDGASQGAIAAKRKVSVRTRSGPHELCVLPETDKRTCGAQGTVRRAYLYEGWALTVRCDTGK